MKMRHLAIGVVLSAALVGCGGGSDYSDEGDAIQPLAEYEFNAREAPQALRSEAAPGQPPPPADEDTIPNEDVAQYIAYSHNLGLSLPQPQVEPVMQGHVAACEAAGSRVCIITNSSLNNQSDDYTSGYLSLRAVPDWIETFQSGVDAEVADAEGEVTSRNKSAVDLTRQILDTDARLNARITLKRRLEVLLATREGELGELLEIERELARVTGEIESMSSNLKALRLRVSMSEMTVNYETKRSLVAGGRSNPLTRAFGDFFYNMSEALAAVVTFFAIGLPWMLLIGIFAFIWLRAIWPWVRKRRAKP